MIWLAALIILIGVGGALWAYDVGRRQ